MTFPIGTAFADGSPGDVLLPIGFDLLWVLVALLPLVLFIAALVSILRSRRYTGGGKLLWALVTFLAPFLGPLAWFLGGKRAQIRTSAP